MPTLENIPHPAMSIILNELDMASLMNLSLTSRALHNSSQCRVRWRKLYMESFGNLWDKNPDKLIRILAMNRFDCVEEVILESRKRRGILTWANLITALEKRPNDLKLILDCNVDGLLPTWFAQLAMSAKCLTIRENMNLTKNHKLELARGIDKKGGKTAHINLECSIKEIKTKEECKLLYKAYKKLSLVRTEDKYLNKPQLRCLKLLAEHNSGKSPKRGAEELCGC